MPLRCWSSSRYTFPLPEGHRFPMGKYAMLRSAIEATDFAVVEEPDAGPRDDVLRVHDLRYVTDLESGTLPPEAVRRLGFPWSQGLVDRSYRAVGGTLAAATHALDAGVAMNLAGGTHHAFADRGEGYCVFNDVVIAWRALRAAGRVRRGIVIDLDVHQGNGTHALCANDRDVVTFSMHGRRNFPFVKVPGSCDIELDDGTDDTTYLDRLTRTLPTLLRDARADIAFYLAGADPHEDDALGRLALSFDGLARRDAFVLESCRSIGLPVCIVIAGGYGRELSNTVRIHVTTAQLAARYS
jgi:acetoin utilization deacetylase AcuC-like enzyme